MPTKCSAYRILDCGLLTDNSLSLQGLLRAYRDGAKIINFSVSTPGGWSSDALSTVVDRLNMRGVTVVVSARDADAIRSQRSLRPVQTTMERKGHL